jgi:hypothetical protein
MTALAPAPEITMFAEMVGQPLQPFVDWVDAQRPDITHIDEINLDEGEEPTPCEDLPARSKKIVIYFTMVNGVETIDATPYIA